ncbi:hypothetical protein MBLNU457_5630t1 [Dothideomycetes sp. NU457]
MSTFFGRLLGQRDAQPVADSDPARTARVNTQRRVATIRRERVAETAVLRGKGNLELVAPLRAHSASIPFGKLSAHPKCLPSVAQPSVRVLGLHSRSIRQKKHHSERPPLPAAWVDAEPIPPPGPRHYGTLYNWSPQQHSEHEDSFVGTGRYKHLRGTPLTTLADKLWEEFTGQHNLWYTGRVGDFLGHHPWILLYPELEDMIRAKVTERDERAGHHRSTSLNFIDESGTRVQRGFTVSPARMPGSSLASSSPSSSGSVLVSQPSAASTPMPDGHSPFPLARVSNLTAAINRYRRPALQPPPTPAATAPIAAPIRRQVTFHLTPPSLPADIMLMPESDGSCAIVSDEEEEEVRSRLDLPEPTPPRSVPGRRVRR